MRWITVGPADQPDTSIVLHPPAADPGITDDERRTIAEMMAKGTYASVMLATDDLDGAFEKLAGQRRRGRPGADRPAVRRPRLRLPRPRRQHGPHQRGALTVRPSDSAQGDTMSKAATTRRRQPRPDPGAGRAREQPQGRQRRDPEAPADGVHRRLRLGQELAGVRHHRRRVAADDQRDLQRVRAGLHADAGAAGGRPARGPDDRDHRRPGADGRQPALHRRHRHRRQRDAADPVQPAREAAHRPADGVLVQRPDAHGERRDEAPRRAAGSRRTSSATRSTTAACARAARAWARSATST